MQRFFVLLKARNLELLRDKATWSWNFIIPIILVLFIALIFGNKDATLYKVGIIGGDHPALTQFKSTRYLQFIDYTDAARALNKLQHHQLDLVIQGSQALKYWINDSSPQGYILEKVLLAASGGQQWLKQSVNGQQVRYLDWVLPGIISINIMHSSLFGVGFVIVRYRKNGVLKRLKATPINAFEFLSAQVVSRLLMLTLAIVIQFSAMHLFFHFVMHGSYSLLLLIALLGAMALISLGLLVASRTSSEEVAGGLLNLITWPMILLSGVWFSLEGAPVFLQKAALALPLTHVLNAARAIMIDGATLPDLTLEITVLASMTLVFLLLASWRFKWTED